MYLSRLVGKSDYICIFEGSGLHGRVDHKLCVKGSPANQSDGLMSFHCGNDGPAPRNSLPGSGGTAGRKRQPDFCVAISHLAGDILAATHPCLYISLLPFFSLCLSPPSLSLTRTPHNTIPTHEDPFYVLYQNPTFRFYP